MINEQQLLEFGMKKMEGDDAILYPYQKELSDPQPENDLGAMMLCVTVERNTAELALIIPSGETLFLGGCEKIEELSVIEKCITEWQPVY